MKRLVTALSLLALGALAQTWNMATPYPPANFHTQNILQFVKEVEEATGGRLKITVHPGGSLFPHPQILPAVRNGQVQMGEVFMSLLANENPLFNLDSIPFVVSGYEDAWRLYQAQRPEVERWLAQRGVVFLYAVPWPPQGLYTKKPVNSAQDLKGLRFRAYNPATARLAELLGMTPVQVEAADIPQAFATGIVEAMITSPTTGVDSQAWDFARYFYDVKA